MTTVDQPVATRFCPDCGVSEDTPGRLCINCKHLKGAGPNLRAATFLRRLSAYLLDIPLLIVTLGIGWLIWWLFTLANGQTPGKQLLGIRAVRDDGRDLGWGLTFVREFVIKGLLVGIISNFTFGIFWVINYLFPLFDKDQQALHDKMMSSMVVKDDPLPASRARINPGDDPWGRQVTN